MLHAFFIHSATIKRASHTISSKEKTTAETTVATGVECLIQELGDSSVASMLGLAATEGYRGTFPRGTDLLIGDEVTWTDPATDEVFVIKTVDRIIGYDSAEETFIGTTLQRRRVG